MAPIVRPGLIPTTGRKKLIILGSIFCMPGKVAHLPPDLGSDDRSRTGAGPSSVGLGFFFVPFQSFTIAYSSAAEQTTKPPSISPPVAAILGVVLAWIYDHHAGAPAQQFHHTAAGQHLTQPIQFSHATGWRPLTHSSSAAGCRQHADSAQRAYVMVVRPGHRRHLPWCPWIGFYATSAGLRGHLVRLAKIASPSLSVCGGFRAAHLVKDD